MRSCHIPWSPPFVILSVRVRTKRQEEAGSAEVDGIDVFVRLNHGVDVDIYRLVQGGPARPVLSIEIGAHLTERLDERKVLVLGGCMK